MAAPSTSGSIIRFGVFEVDLSTRELRREGRKIRLQEQPFRLLALLVQRPGEVVTREELQQALWPADTFVEFDHGLNTAIKKIRQALDDSAETPQFIETLPRQGYRFIGSLAERINLLQERKQPSRIRRGLLLGAGILAMAFAAFWMRTSSRVAPSSDGVYLAVLPFTNLSSDRENEYFTDGLRLELIRALTNVEQLRVIEVAKTEQIPELTKKLHLRAVFSGSVRKSENRLRIAADLIDAGDQHHLWSETFDRDLKDVFAVQEEIARAIVRTLEVRLKGNDNGHLARPYPVSIEAYSLYLKGRYLLQKYDVENAKRAIQYFEQAIAIDSRYALAYAGLSDSYDVLCDNEVIPPAEGLWKRKQAAQMAIELDPNSPEVIAAWGGTGVEGWDWPSVERNWKLAIELKPNYPMVHSWYGLVLAGFGRFPEALAEAKRGADLNPVSPSASLKLALIYYWAHRYDDALEQLRKISELEPDWSDAYGLLGCVHLLQGAREPALAELTKAAELSGHASSDDGMLGQAYGMCGRTREARQILSRLMDKSKREYVGPINIAHIYAGLGERDQAFAWLDRAFQKNASAWPLALMDPMWGTLRPDPRFADIVKRVGLKN